MPEAQTISKWKRRTEARAVIGDEFLMLRKNGPETEVLQRAPALFVQDNRQKRLVDI
jgi:hypothetical protein